MRNARLGVGIAGVAAATLFVPALVGASSSAPLRVNASTPTVLAAATSAPATSATGMLPTSSYPPHRPVLTIRPGNRTYQHPTRVTFGGRLFHGTNGRMGVTVQLINAATGDVVGRDTTDRTGRWGITIRVQKTNRYYVRYMKVQSRTVTITIRNHHHHHAHH